ncbi:MAG: hypothetical protein ABI867_22620 [Kofleriaceae bacterium]
MSLLARSIVFSSLVAALATPAAAATHSITSGLGCVQAYGAWEAKMSYGDEGFFYSDATDWYRTAVCPLPHASQLYGGATATVEVLDRSYDLDVSCRIVTRSPQWVIWGAAKSSSGSNTNGQSLTVNLATGLTTGNSHVLCYLPPVYQGNRSAVVGVDATIQSL